MTPSGPPRRWCAGRRAAACAALLLTLIGTVRAADNTPVRWLEGPGARSEWEGARLERIMDEETGEACIEWYQDPATKAKATVTMRGIKPGQYDVARLQWKYMGGGSGLTVQIGRRRWYLYKDSYRPGQWHDSRLRELR